jgi:hypothetical protein
VEMVALRHSTEAVGGAPMGQMVPDVRRRDWSQCHTFYSIVGRWKAGGSGGRTSMMLVMGDGNGEEESMGCNHLQRGREGGDEAAPLCRRQTIHQRVARRPGRLKAMTDI